MKKTTSNLSLLLTSILLFNTSSYAQSAQDYAVNQRTGVTVSAVEHAHLMTEMNDFLKAIHDIQTALAVKDMETVAAIASKFGPKNGKHDAVGKSLHEKLPKEWFAIAKPTHQNFLAIATEAQKKSSVESILAAVSKTTAQCISCHATYKLNIAP